MNESDVLKVLNTGALGEGGEWQIVRNYVGEERWCEPCPHAVNFRTEPSHEQSPHSNPPIPVNRWDVPVVIVAFNECGNNATILCAQCVKQVLSEVLS